MKSLFTLLAIYFALISNYSIAQVIIDDFETNRKAVYGYRDGTYSVAANPAANSVNSSATVGRYIRNVNAQYDVMRLQVNGYFNDVSSYGNGTRTLRMKVYSPAAGIPVQLSFEDTNQTTATNYPTGRYCVLSTTTTVANQWEELTFRFNTRPDASVSPLVINTILLSFNINSFTNGIYYFDDVQVPDYTPLILVWADEFNGSSLESNKWNIEVNDLGGYNNELQYYSARPDNISVSNGMLTITALNQFYINRNYSSGRLNTSRKAGIKYGRVVVRAKVPAGQGLWPAVWMLPTDEVYGGWPRSGEIDLMEVLGQDPNTSYSTIHYGNPSHLQNSVSYNARGANFANAFHVFEVAWTPSRINFFVDSVAVSSINISSPFDQRFHVVLNLAVGGNWPGSPNASTTFPARMLVDYVRLYSSELLCDAPATPNISVTGSTSTCEGNSVQLQAPAGFRYLWNNGDTSRNIAVTTSGAYQVRTILGNCTSAVSSVANVTVNPIPSTPTISPAGTITIAAGTSTTLIAPANYAAYLWSNGATTRTISVNEAGVYSVVGISSAACTSATSMATTVAVSLTSTTWDGITWSNGIPTNSLDAIVNANYTANAGFSAKSLTINAGVFTINSPISVIRNLINNSTSTKGASRIILNGSTAQSIAGLFRNLTINNASGVSLSGSVGIEGVLELTQGALSVNTELLTFFSSTTSQAMIDDFSSGFSGTIIGNYDFNIVPQGNTVSFRHIAAPVSGVILGSLGTNCNLYQGWTESRNAWSYLSANCASQTLPTGKSVLKAVQGNTLVNFRGGQVSGTISVPMVRTNAVSNATVQYGFNAIGNPYPSAIDWSKMKDVSGNTAVSNLTAYIWKSGQWATITSMGVATLGISKFIAPGQGILLRRSTVGGNANLVFNNIVRSTTYSSFVREATQPEQIKISVSNNQNSITDEVVLFGNENATEGLDDIDAVKLFSVDSNAPSLYIVDSEALTIAAYPMLQESGRIVPIEIKAANSGVYSLQFDYENLPHNLHLTLEDVSENRFYEVNNASFNLKTNEIKALRLHFNKKKIQESNISIYPNPVSNDFNINCNVATDVVIYNSLGQAVFHKWVESPSVIATQNWSEGIYTIITDGNKAIKLVVKK